MKKKHKIDRQNRGKELDLRVIPMVNYFNEFGLKTVMSCQGHDNLGMSIFWISFAPSVTDDDIIRFQRQHFHKYGGFCSCGRFAQRIYTGYKSTTYEWCYFAASPEAADEDLKNWKAIREQN